MDYQQVLQARANRNTRLARPFANFFASFDQCTKAGEAILNDSIAPEFRSLLERSIVITAVTAIEVYYRDMLDYLFRYCAPSFFEPKLKLLHSEKFDIQDMMNVYEHNIHPLEIVSSAQSFQNVERIDKVFSMFMDKGLWKSVLCQQVRRKDDVSNVVSWCAEDLAGMKKIFMLRHELVHDPAHRAFMTDEVHTGLGQAAHMVFGTDIILGRVLVDNKDPALNDDAAV